tara:strand:+ start:318 stop:503 length:186 start_codon:yes stop_codon:yes gene_type:complete
MTKGAKVTKIIKSFAIDRDLYKQFQEVADKDQRKYSNIVEAGIKKYVAEKKDNLFKGSNLF